MTPTKGKVRESYTIKEITKAWYKFTEPKWLISNKEIDLDSLETGTYFETDDVPSARRLPIDYSRWIPYLISEEWLK